MEKLPLSWCSEEIKSSAFHPVDLPLSGLTWIPTAEIPCDYSIDDLYRNLVSDYPEFVIRGLSAETAAYFQERGSDVVRTGAEAVVSLDHLEDMKPSVLELARRGGRWGRVKEILYSDINAGKLFRFINESAHAPEPRLSHLFRSGFDQSTRCFVLTNDKDGWLGAVTISSPRQPHAHTELILRSRSAPVGVMEAIFVSLMRTLKDEGYSHFSLGEVPFISSESGDSVPGLSGLYLKEYIFQSERFHKLSFNYKGLYDFKNKFGPKWQPVYLAAKPALSWRLMLDLYFKSRYFDLSLFKFIDTIKKKTPDYLKTG